MSYAGIVVCSIVIDKTMTKILSPVEIVFPGCLDDKKDIYLIDYIKTEILLLLKDKLRDRKNSLSDLEKYIKSGIKNIIKNSIGKVPQIIVKVIILIEKDTRVKKIKTLIK